MENYPDMKSAAVMGIYEADVDEMHVEYAMPQENGHREQIHWMSVGNQKESLLICAKETLGMDIHHYTIEALDKAKHVGEIQTYANKTRINDYSMKLCFHPVKRDDVVVESKKVRVIEK